MAQYNNSSRFPTPSSQRSATQTPSRDTSRISREAVAKRAYEKFLARGRKHGHDKQDWLEAEQELKNESRRN